VNVGVACPCGTNLIVMAAEAYEALNDVFGGSPEKELEILEHLRHHGYSCPACGTSGELPSEEELRPPGRRTGRCLIGQRQIRPQNRGQDLGQDWPLVAASGRCGQHRPLPLQHRKPPG
jgi:hypothetical protein